MMEEKNIKPIEELDDKEEENPTQSNEEVKFSRKSKFKMEESREKETQAKEKTRKCALKTVNRNQMKGIEYQGYESMKNWE
jgi:hypothetical protein